MKPMKFIGLWRKTSKRFPKGSPSEAAKSFTNEWNECFTNQRNTNVDFKSLELFPIEASLYGIASHGMTLIATRTSYPAMSKLTPEQSVQLGPCPPITPDCPKDRNPVTIKQFLLLPTAPPQDCH
jgi:hypothetical protein